MNFLKTRNPLRQSIICYQIVIVMEFKIDDRRQQIRERDYRHIEDNHGDWDLSKDYLIIKNERRYGYDFNVATCESKILKEEAETFANKLDKYYGNRKFIKRLDQDQKRERKEKHSLEFKPNRIKARLERVDQIIRNNLMSILFEKNKNKNRY